MSLRKLKQLRAIQTLTQRSKQLKNLKRRDRRRSKVQGRKMKRKNLILSPASLLPRVRMGMTHLMKISKTKSLSLMEMMRISMLRSI